MIDGQFIGLMSIALALFLGLFFGLSGFRKDITGKLDTIAKDISGKLDIITGDVREIKGNSDKIWDLLLQRPTGTVEGKLQNLGKIKIAAEPGASKTSYVVEVEHPVLREDYLRKLYNSQHFIPPLRLEAEELFVYAPNRLKISLHSTDPKACTKFMNYFMRWLDSTYIESLNTIEEFEKAILD